tara:strand:+ start:200 stop:1771 length:1572 start_codon:yes stop_codon:yes gene_type:complete
MSLFDTHQARKIRADLKNLTIKKSTKTERFNINIKNINKLWQNKTIISVEDWLQRCSQEGVWTKNNHKKSRSFMNSLVIESKSYTQSMSFVKGETIIKLLEETIEDNSLEYVQIAKTLLKKLRQAAKQVGDVGKLCICIDGQNRSLYAIGNFFKNLYPINLSFCEQPEKSGSFFYDELPQTIQEQIDNLEIQVDLIDSIDIEKVLDRIVAMNEGEPWTPTERRSVSFTPVSFLINNLAADPIVSWFFKQVLVNYKEHGISGVTKEYNRHKKGDILILSELLHYAKHFHFGSAKQLDELYKEKLKDSITISFQSIVKFIANTFHSNQTLLKDIKVLSMIKDLFICMTILTQEQHTMYGAMYGSNKVMSLNDVKDKFRFIQILLNSMTTKYFDPQDRVPVESKGKRMVPKPGSWAFHHTAQKQTDIKAREEFLVTKEPKILKTAYLTMTQNNTVGVGYERQDIDKATRMQLELENKRTDYERFNDFVPANVKTVDHITPVSKGGSNDISNLGLMSKKLNSSKGAR